MVTVQLLGLAEHLLGRALHYDAAPAHDQHAVSLGGFLHIVGDGHDGDARRPQLVDGFHDLGAAVGIQHGGGLIQHQAVGPHGDNARDGDALLLAAAQLIRRSIAFFVDAGQLHGLVDAGADLLRRYAEVFRRKGHVLFNDGRYDLVVGVLEHHADLLTYIVEVVLVAGVHALHEDSSGLGQQNRVEMLCQRGFAAAVRAQHGHELTAADVQCHAVHSVLGLLRIIAEVYVLRL